MRKKRKTAKPLSTSSDLHEARHLSILLLDDREDNLILEAAILRSNGYAVVPCRSVDEAMLHLDEIDIAVLDYHLGGGRWGTEVAEALSQKYPEIPIILRSANPDYRAKRMAGTLLLKGYHGVNDLLSILKKVVPTTKRRSLADKRMVSANVVRAANPRAVWVIYGRDERLRQGMFTFLRSIGLEPLEFSIARKQTREPLPYIGEILEAGFLQAQAVVVLLSPDDEARLRPDLQREADPAYEAKLTGQARPNVLFEAGMAFVSHSDR